MQYYNKRIFHFPRRENMKHNTILLSFIFLLLFAFLFNSRGYAINITELSKLKKQLKQVENQEKALKNKRNTLLNKIKVLQKKLNKGRIIKHKLTNVNNENKRLEPILKYKDFKVNTIYCLQDKSQKNPYCKAKKKSDGYSWIFKNLENKVIKGDCQGETLSEVGNDYYHREKKKAPLYSWIFKTDKKTQNNKVCSNGELYHSF